VLRAAFIGSWNRVDEILVHWLSARTELVGVVWTDATAWRHTHAGRLAFARERVRRHGLLKALDELGFYLYYHRRLAAADFESLEQAVVAPYVERHGRVRWSGDALHADDVNGEDVCEFLERRRPDVVFAMCINVRFSERLRAIPRHGVFLWHEGITPEYKGLYSPFWAVHELDFDRIGYTLLRMNDRLDAGEVFVQGRARDVDPRRHHHVMLGHKAIWDSLPEVETFLRELEAGTARPIDRTGARSASYTYPGLSDLVRQRRRLRRAASLPAP
jgi:hypothetical protein